MKGSNSLLGSGDDVAPRTTLIPPPLASFSAMPDSPIDERGDSRMGREDALASIGSSGEFGHSPTVAALPYQKGRSGLERRETVAAIVPVCASSSVVVDLLLKTQEPELSWWNRCLKRAGHIALHTLITAVGLGVGAEFSLLSANAVDELWQKIYYGISSDLPNSLGTMLAILAFGKLFKDIRKAIQNDIFDRAEKILFSVANVMAFSAAITTFPLAADSVDPLIQRYIDGSANRQAARVVLQVLWAVCYTYFTRVDGAYKLGKKKYEQWGLMARWEPEKHFLLCLKRDLDNNRALIPVSVDQITTEFAIAFYQNPAVVGQLAITTGASSCTLRSASTGLLMGSCVDLLPFGMDLARRGVISWAGNQYPEGQIAYISFLIGLHATAAMAGLTFMIFYVNMASLIIDRTEKVFRVMWDEHHKLSSLFLMFFKASFLLGISFGSARGLYNEAVNVRDGKTNSPYLPVIVQPELVGGLAGMANGNFMLGFIDTIQERMKKYKEGAFKTVADELFSAYDLEEKRKAGLTDLEASQEGLLEHLGSRHHAIEDFPRAIEARQGALVGGQHRLMPAPLAVNDAEPREPEQRPLLGARNRY